MEINNPSYVVRFANEPNLNLLKKATENYMRRVYAESYRAKEPNQRFEESNQEIEFKPFKK